MNRLYMGDKIKDLMIGWMWRLREKDLLEISLGFWQPNRQIIVSKKRFRNQASSIWGLYCLQLMASKVPVFIYIKRQINSRLKMRTFYGAGLEMAYITLLYSFGHTCEESWEIVYLARKKSKGVLSLVSSLCLSAENQKMSTVDH